MTILTEKQKNAVALWFLVTFFHVFDLYSTDLKERSAALNVLYRVNNPGLLGELLVVSKIPLLVMARDRYTGRVTYRLYRFWRRCPFGPINYLRKGRI